MAKMTHPKGLYLLFTLEMWERFSYYGMRALLFLYMTKALAFDSVKAGDVYGWYTSLVYLTPLLGGFLADRFWGQRKTVLFGGIIMMLGHFAMAFSEIEFFYSALILLIIGNGLFKPNISTMVGQLYGPDDPRRESGFSIFYMGINLGALLAPIICGTLGEKIDWHYGFTAAGVGMALGLIIYLLGQNRYLGDIGKQPAYQQRNDDTPKLPLTLAERHRMMVIGILVLFSICFWAAFEQAGSSLTLFADRATDRSLPGFITEWVNGFVAFLNRNIPFREPLEAFDGTYPASYFQSVNPLFIIILAPIFANLWISLARKDREPSTPMKFFYALVLIVIAFVVMVWAASVYMETGNLVAPTWLLMHYLFATIGELFLSPVGLSKVSKLSPPRYTSMMMGVWFLSSFIAGKIAGSLGGLFDTMPLTDLFMIPVVFSGAAALLMLAFSKKIKSWMHGIH